MLLTNGRIHTMDAAGSVVDSLVIRDGRVAFAGRRADITPAPGEPTLDLGGRAVLPGLVDGHGHLMLLARTRLELNLAAARSEEEIARLVAAAAARRRPGEWITGRGWDQTRWVGQAYPSRASLDRAAPGHPVALIRVDGHATWASGEASMQPTHCTSDMRWAGERLGPERLAGAYAWRSVLDAGAYLAGGSDFPVEDANPFHGLHAAVTRRPLEGPDPGWQPEQRMTRAEAVRSFTIWNARSVGLEAEQGSLEVGKRADLIALSDDVFTCAPSSIGRITPTMVMVGGAVVVAGVPGPG